MPTGSQKKRFLQSGVSYLIHVLKSKGPLSTSRSQALRLNQDNRHAVKAPGWLGTVNIRYGDDLGSEHEQGCSHRSCRCFA